MRNRSSLLSFMDLSSSPTSHYPMMMLPTGPALSVLPGPVHIPSVINVRNKLYKRCSSVLAVICYYICICTLHGLQLARPMCMVPNIPGIPGPPLGGSSSGSNSPSGYSVHSEAKMVSTNLALYFYLLLFSSFASLFSFQPSSLVVCLYVI